MTNPFSSLEIQLIRASLANKSDEEIAELLERPVEEIVEKINELTSGGAADRSNEVANLKLKQEEEKLQKKKRPATVKIERKVIEQQYENKAKKKTRSIEFENNQRRKQVEAMSVNRRFKTRTIDYSNMKSVRVNRSTFVWVDKNVPDKEAIKKYNDNLDFYNRKFLPTN